MSIMPIDPCTFGDVLKQKVCKHIGLEQMSQHNLWVLR